MKISEKTPIKKKQSNTDISIIDSDPKAPSSDEHVIGAEKVSAEKTSAQPEQDEPTSPKLPAIKPPVKTPVVVPSQKPAPKDAASLNRPLPKREIANASVMQERCRQLALTTFFREHSPIRSLGFTSAIAGEGKSFLTTVMARVLANDSSNPVTILECNWGHPTLYEHFGISGTPGLAEWLRGECTEHEIRREVAPNLTLIPAGNGRMDAVKLLQQMRSKGLLNLFSRSDELFIVDLPPVITAAYGALAASLVESLIVVLRAGVTTDLMVAETTEQLKDLPVQGIVLNQVESRIPRWIRQLL